MSRGTERSRTAFQINSAYNVCHRTLTNSRKQLVMMTGTNRPVRCSVWWWPVVPHRKRERAHSWDASLEEHTACPTPAPLCVCLTKGYSCPVKLNRYTIPGKISDKLMLQSSTMYSYTTQTDATQQESDIFRNWAYPSYSWVTSVCHHDDQCGFSLPVSASGQCYLSKTMSSISVLQTECFIYKYN